VVPNMARNKHNTIDCILFDLMVCLFVD